MIEAVINITKEGILVPVKVSAPGGILEAHLHRIGQDEGETHETVVTAHVALAPVTITVIDDTVIETEVDTLVPDTI